jgi:peptidoglycan/LPS O-acetylase OafA/YrhL
MLRHEMHAAPSRTRIPRLPHIAALDGIRALAVGGVLLYHGGVTWVPGGFLGVDVFFVLSGFLITSLLLAETRASGGAIDLKRFWIRRARRLLPAAFLLIAVCVVVAVAFLPDGDRTRDDALASLVYLNNWHQVGIDASYFEAFGRPSLLQHLWSLSVEEQFYLVWPLLLGLLLRRGRAVAAAVTAAGVVGSVVAMALLFHPGTDPTRVYFGTDTHAFGLLLGALLAFAWPLGGFRREPRPGARRLLDAGAVLGLAGILALMATVHDFDPLTYRGGIALASLATVLLIAAASHPACGVARVLGTPVLRWIGERSYGIYLWHWPVMALTRPGIDVHWSLWLLVPAQIAGTVLIAAASYRFVEQPIRTGSARAWLDRRPPRGRLGIAVASVATVCATFAWVAAHDARVSSASAQALERPPTLTATSTPAAATVPRKQPTAATTTRPPHGRPLAVGASVMLAASPELSRFATVDAAVGRQPTEIIARLRAIRSARQLPSRVIVQLGENGPLWGDDVRALKAVLKGVDRVVLVNVRVPRSWEDQVNGILGETAGGWKAAHLADWYDASDDASLLYGDGTHPNPAGERVYAQLVRRALT